MKKVYFIFLFTLSFFGVLTAQQNGDKPWRIGLALSGGGAKGLAHIGALKVLDEANIPIHAIAGTSMGSVVGAFYSAGYSPAEIEQIMTTMDWQSVISDNLQRQFYPMIEKERESRYIGSLELKQGAVSLPSGIINGQMIGTILSEKLWLARHIHDFKKLPIPFICVATDIASGTPITLSSGYLPDALRASMAIPTFFTPQMLDGRMLVDGSITRNFPAQNVREEFEVDYIIGIDVGTTLRSADELQTLIEIMDQTINLGSYLTSKEQRGYCDIIIDPNLDGLVFSDFDQVDEFIDLGEIAARAALPKILEDLEHQHVADKIPAKARKAELAHNVTKIDTIQFHGVEKNDIQAIRRELNLPASGWVTASQISRAVDRLYSTQLYQRVGYKPLDNNEHEALIIDVQKRNHTTFQFGFHYDSRDAAKILLNTTFRNFTGRHSALSFDLQLAKFPQFDAEYYTRTNNFSAWGFLTRAFHHSHEFDFYQQENRIARLRNNSDGLQLYFGTIYSKSLNWGLGYEIAYNDLELEIGTNDSMFDSGTRTGKMAMQIHYDTQDRSEFPREGVSVKLLSEYAHENLLSETTFWRHSLFAKGLLPVHRRWTLIGEMHLGYAGDEPLELINQFFLGGPERFVGYKNQGLNGNAVQAVGMALQFEPLYNKYITLRVNVGNTFPDWRANIRKNEYLTGVGLFLGTLTPFGPAELSLSSSKRHNAIIHLSFGYAF